jgi:C-terminal processing protease CtpA/Prc
MRALLRRSVFPALLLGAILTLQASDALDQTRRLGALCRVWGLLKYYHPGVVTGTIDWDEALVEAIPRVEAAETREDLNHELLTLARMAGMSLPDRAAAGSTFPRDVFGWLDDRQVFDPVVAAYLKLIATGNQPVPVNRYAKGVQNVGNPDFSGDTDGYDGPAYPDPEHRLLGLFRYWNMVQYFCPNRGLIDRDWGDVLEEFIPRMQRAANQTDYHLALAELIANINDTHGITGSGVVSGYWGSYRLPVRTRLVQGQTVIVQVFPRFTAGADLRVGDMISQIDGTPTATVRAGFRKYINASNPDSLERDIDGLLLRSTSNATRSLTVTHDDGASAAIAVTPVTTTDWYNEYNAARDLTAYRMLPDNIGYVAMGILQVADIPAVMQALQSTRAMIFDVRAYPNGTMWSLMPYLEPTARAMARFVQPDYSHPGSFFWQQPVVLGPSAANPDYYKGRLVVLMDENTQSQAEYSVMGFRSAPATTVIGSRTAGADGNVSLIRLPGGFYTYFSGITPYYPDGRPTQRVGIVPDIEVRPTIAGIRQGRDEVLEQAVAFINGQETTGGHGASPSTARDDRARDTAVRVRSKRDR